MNRKTAEVIEKGAGIVALSGIIFVFLIIFGFMGCTWYGDYHRKSSMIQYCSDHDVKIVSLERVYCDDSAFRLTNGGVVYKVTVLDKESKKHIIWFKFRFLEQMEFKENGN